MGKMKTLIEKYTTNFKKKLRGKLEALPPKARLGIVLTAFAAFASLCLYMTVTAITGFGKGNGAMEIRHIEKLDLPVQEERGNGDTAHREIGPACAGEYEPI